MRNYRDYIGKYRCKERNLTIRYDGSPSYTFVQEKYCHPEDRKDLHKGLLGVAIMLSPRQIWEVPDESNVIDEKDGSMLICRDSVILSIRVEDLEKYFEKIK